jgi:predicted metal-dependent peptidase
MAYIERAERYHYPEHGWAIVSSDRRIYCHPTRRAEPDEWLWVLTHALLHLGFGHLHAPEMAGDHDREWSAACDYVVARFQTDLKLGRPPEGVSLPRDFPPQREEQLYRRFVEDGIPPELWRLGTAGAEPDMVLDGYSRRSSQERSEWQRRFGEGLTAAVTSAVNVAAGVEPHLGSEASLRSVTQLARSWFISSYPLLGSLAASFRLIEDAALCMRMEISIAAVNMEAQEIYLNPAAGLNSREWRFVMAHELLHVGLRHDARCAGRDPFLWNVACDYVINAWLIEMGVGEQPAVGLLYDPALQGLSAEAIYDRIVTDMRRHRKLATLRGKGLGDILGPSDDWWARGGATDLDAFYRRCLAQGLTYHGEWGRGYLPAGLIEEIRALAQPPIPWEVDLAAWFDGYFTPLEHVRSYSRPSRRQSATPNIPRPRYVPALGATDKRTFGVVLDTSDSMDRVLLAKALGAVASYSMSRDIPAVRVVFCDAAAYDQGYLPPEAVADRVKVRGRGGTVLQPGIDLLERAEDFPSGGPLLIITDGYCDRVRIRHTRQHAFLLPAGHRLPFIPNGPVFRLQ